MRLYLKNNLFTAATKRGYRHLSNNSDSFKPRSKQPIVDIKYYKILGLNLDETITDEILQKAVNKRLHQVHPDKGGSNKETMAVLAAREAFRRFILNSSSDDNTFNDRTSGSESSSGSKIPWYAPFILTIMCLSPAVAFGLLNSFVHKKEPKKEPTKSRLNYWQIITLNALASRGLTEDMLLLRNENGYEFEQHHAWALASLVKSHHFTVIQALKEIDGLNSTQAYGIEKGLTRDDVINVTNDWHILTLINLASHGLTADMLLSRNEDGHEFGDHHSGALANLIIGKHFTVIQALEEIDGLNYDQVRGIEAGLTREDVMHSKGPLINKH